MRLKPTAAVAIALAAAAAATPLPSSAEVGDLARMSLREKVGQLVMFGISGTGLTDAERELIRRHHLGGVILFADNYRDREQLRNLTTQIQNTVRRGSGGIGALISVDQEGGVVKRFPDMPPWRSHPEIGATGDPSVAFAQGQDAGRALRNAGVNVNLAPVGDLDLPPEHVMRSRSFGSRVRLVARMTRSFARGLQSRRTAATAKHFPGLGGATINSDHGRAYVYRTKRQLRRADVVPFRRATEGGLKLMMLSHGIYVNHGGRRPASVNRFIATHRLRNEVGFEGVAISDALEPVAWKFDGSVPRACRATVWAGADIALITGHADAAAACANEIVRGVREGGISEARITRAARRVLELKRWLGVLN